MHPNSFPAHRARVFRRALALLFVCIQTASAGIVYQQPPVWAGNGTDVGNGLTSQSDASVTGFRTFDNFSLGTAATINHASWLGIYVNEADFTDGAPNTSSWVIRISADNAGAPGATLSQTTLAAGQVTVQTLGTGLFGNNTVTVYDFMADLNSFNAAAGTTYWFTPLSRATTFSPLFSWIEGTGGDGASFQIQFAGGANTASFVQEGDRAFSLATVSEPSTSFLIFAGLAGFAWLRRRPSSAALKGSSPILRYA